MPAQCHKHHSSCNYCQTYFNASQTLRNRAFWIWLVMLFICVRSTAHINSGGNVFIKAMLFVGCAAYAYFLSHWQIAELYTIQRPADGCGRKASTQQGLEDLKQIGVALVAFLIALIANLLPVR